MDRQIRAVNLGLIVFALYFFVSFAVDVVLLYKVMFLFDKAGFWTLGISNLLFGDVKWKMGIGITLLAVFHLMMGIYAIRLHIRRADAPAAQ